MPKKNVPEGRYWSPRGPAAVWLVLWTGDWGTSYEIYGRESLAWESVAEFMKNRVMKWPEEYRPPVLEPLARGLIWPAFNAFSEYENPSGNDLDVQKVIVEY